ncbi:uncharacterized protein F4812DRAFT_435521 [Daldinia caldariorum]|uniref:uncharacterized protein n=1 Tax=Daldinia caldariorum TaxID=326644 RepID=UPI0020072208|nr:uncharacterized protein F4812DRAFT_435521 [Daldinia caldariorum]KAI1466004.1 hypothetical protein F4812DRAFT_435521 [Daldinia caldariorum]
MLIFDFIYLLNALLGTMSGDYFYPSMGQPDLQITVDGDQMNDCIATCMYLLISDNPIACAYRYITHISRLVSGSVDVCRSYVPNIVRSQL